MFRYLERAENTARLIDAGFRIALTRSTDSAAEWKSVILTAGVEEGYREKFDTFNGPDVIDYLIRDTDNPSSVMSGFNNARTNARLVRTALTAELWEAVNEGWMALNAVLKRPIRDTELPDVLRLVRQQCALVRGASQGTMFRNDIFDFLQIGIMLERADSTARIIDVKYYTLLPSASPVGSSLDNVQWETVLRSVSAHKSFDWFKGEMSSASITDLLILDARFPRSLAFCAKYLVENLGYLEKDYGERLACHDKADALLSKLKQSDINEIFDIGLHEFITEFIRENNAVGRQIEIDYRFNG